MTRTNISPFAVSARRSRPGLEPILTLSIGFILLSGAAVASAQENPARSISVSGTVEASVAPDQIRWQISLAATDPDLSEAKARSDEQVKAVVALRQKLGIQEGDLQTGPVSVNREYERDAGGGRGEFKHFVVHRTVQILQRDLKRFDEFLNTLVGATEMEVYFNFESSRIAEVRAETRLEALRVARKKAAQMAAALDEKLGRVLTINEHSSDGGWRNVLSNMAVTQSTPPADLTTETFVPGSITVPVTVHVTFALE